MKTTIVLLLLIVPSIARAQDAPRFDIKPIAAVAGGVVFDTFSTHRFIGNGSGCVERTELFTQAPYSPAQPNFRRIWSLNAIGIGSAVAANVIAHRERVRAPQSKSVKVFSAVVKSYSYVGGAWRASRGVRNVSLCGW